MNIVGARFKGKKDIDKIFSKVESYREEHDVFLQLFDPSKVIGEEHLLWAYQKAEETFENDENRADSLEMETLLWSSAEWQIKYAIDKMGVKEDKAAVMIDEEPEKFFQKMGWEREEKILQPKKEKLENFGISQKEIESVTLPYDLVFEMMATSIL